MREHRVDLLALGNPLAPRRQRDEYRAEVGRRGARERVEAAEQVEPGDAGRLQEDLLDLVRHGVGALDRGALGQLEADDEIALVLVGDERGRDRAEEHHGGDEQHRENAEHDAAAREQRAHALVVALDHRGESAVERAEERRLVLALGAHHERA